MENVAAVTFAENYIKRGEYDRFAHERYTSTVLHEMAHMWFGNLVTKNWWNGLWLNESFATYMAAVAKGETTEFSDGWHSFYLTGTLPAFNADQLVTTHPIEVPVPSTSDFYSIFDEITYGKGASVLNQLSHFVGEENFRLGVSNYLKDFSYSNTTLEDFMHHQSIQSGMELGDWSQEWLYQAGVNNIRAEYSCANGVISEFAVHQTAPSDLPTLRSHKIQVGLYSAGDDGVQSIAKIPTMISGAKTMIPEAVGVNCPQLVYPNVENWGYVKVTLDHATTENLRDTLSSIDDAFLRSMYWEALSTMAGNGQLAFPEFMEIVKANVVNEGNDRVLNQMLGYVRGVKGLANQLGKGQTPEMQAVMADIQGLMWTAIGDPALAYDKRNQWFTAYVSLSSQEESFANLMALLDGTVEIEGYAIDQERRWNMIAQLNANDVEGAKNYLAQERMADTSYGGVNSAIAAEASQPDLAMKEKWVSIFLDDDSDLNLEKQRSAMGTLFPSTQTDLQEAVLDRLLAGLPHLGNNRGAYYLSAFTPSVLNGLCSAEAVAKLNRAIGNDAIDNATVRKFLREAHQNAQACVALK